MMISRDKMSAAFRDDSRAAGKLLDREEREALVKPYLPDDAAGTSSALENTKSTPTAPASTTTKTRTTRRKPIRSFVGGQVHLLFFSILHLFFSLYIHLRRLRHAVVQRVSAVLYYHHRTPELIQKDVRGLSRLPQHLSVVLRLPAAAEEELAGLDAIEVSTGTKRKNKVRSSRDALERLLDQVAEVSAWCACAGIPLLSVYERSGVLKQVVPATHRAVAAKLHAYFGPTRPSLQVRAPHMQTFLNGDVSDEGADGGDGDAPANDAGHLSLLLLSAEDGRSTMVDLTRTLAEMAQQSKLAAADVTWELIDSELGESVCTEPDLLMLFGPNVALDGYPPWPLRLTEIFHQQDNERVEYLVWLKGLHRFAKAQMRFGR